MQPARSTTYCEPKQASKSPRYSALDTTESTERLWIIGLWIYSFSLYLLSMPKTIALEDDSLFLLSAYFNGISHPPGYPVFTYFTHLLMQIPIAEPAVIGHGCSALFGACAVATLFAILRKLQLQRLLAAAITVTFSVTATFWSQAIITEVYTLNCFLNLLILFLAIKINLNEPRTLAIDRSAPPEDPLRPPVSTNRNLLYLMAIVAGLSLANHWPLTLLAAPGYLLLIYRSLLKERHLPLIIALCLTIAAIPYLAMYYNSQSDPNISYRGPLTDITDLISFVLRRDYQQSDIEMSAGWLDKWHFLTDFIQQASAELNTLTLFLFGGLFLTLLHIKKGVKSATFGIITALIYIAFSNSLLLILLLKRDYGAVPSYVFSVYPIITIATLFILCGFSLNHLMKAKLIPNQKIWVTATLIAATLINLINSLPTNYRHNYRWATEFAETTLNALPPQATVLAEGEMGLGLLIYQQQVLGKRPDLTFYEPHGLLLQNRPAPTTHTHYNQLIIDMIRSHPEKMFFSVASDLPLEKTKTTLWASKLGKNTPNWETAPRKISQAEISPDDIDLLVQWSDNRDTLDFFTHTTLSGLRQKAVTILILSKKMATSETFNTYLNQQISRLIYSDSDKLNFIMVSIKNLDNLNHINKEHFKKELTNLNRRNLTSKEEQAHYIYSYHLLHSDVSDQEKRILLATVKACDEWPNKENNYCKQWLKESP